MIQDYLEDVLQRLADAHQNHPSDLALGAPYLLDLLPDRWAEWSRSPEACDDQQELDLHGLEKRL